MADPESNKENQPNLNSKEKYRLTSFQKMPNAKALLFILVLFLLIPISFLKWEATAGSDCTLVAAKDRFLIVAAQTEGILKDIKVKDGDIVEEGALLGLCSDIEIDRQLLRLRGDIEQLENQLIGMQSQLFEQQANVGRAQSYYNHRHLEAEELRGEADSIARVTQQNPPDSQYPHGLMELRAQIRARLSDEQEKQIERQRYELLVKQGLAAESLLSAAKNRFNIAEQERFAAEDRLAEATVVHARKTNAAIAEERMAGEALKANQQKLHTIEANIQLIQSQVQGKKNELILTEQKRELLAIRSPRAGMILGRDIEKRLGQYFIKGSELCKIAETSKLQAIAEVSEWDIARIRVGSQIRFRMRSLSDQIFEGTVSYVSTEVIIKPETKERVYNCEITIDNRDNLLRPGMSGFARVSLGKEPIHRWAYNWFKRAVRFEYWVW